MISFIEKISVCLVAEILTYFRPFGLDVLLGILHGNRVHCPVRVDDAQISLVLLQGRTDYVIRLQLYFRVVDEEANAVDVCAQKSDGVLVYLRLEDVYAVCEQHTFVKRRNKQQAYSPVNARCV